jgi:hypothetical protein
MFAENGTPGCGINSVAALMPPTGGSGTLVGAAKE